jgi:dipeptidyl aminopeptidase/acylaminoacyl peptidase
MNVYVRRKSMRKYLLLVLFIAIAVFSAGCLDQLAIPGIAVSPDGFSYYFLSGDAMSSDGSGALSVVGMGGTPATIVESNDDRVVSAFDVHPSEGWLAYVMVSQTEGTTIVRYDPDSGSSSTLAGAGSFGRLGFGTTMAFSPDGSMLALSMVLLPESVTIDDIQSGDSELSEDELGAFTYELVIVDVASGSVRPVSDATGEKVFNLAWNPSSTRVAYNAWLDSNGDGVINTLPIDPAASDYSEIRVVDTSGTAVASTSNGGISYGPVFLDDDTVAYISLDPMSMMMGGGTQVRTLGMDGSSTNLYETVSLVSGLAVSPDGTQVAWTESESEMDMGITGEEETEGESDETPPPVLYVADTSFSSPRVVTELIGFPGMADVPVWIDSNTVAMTSTSLVATLMGGFSASFDFSMDMDEEGVETEGDASTNIPSQQIVQVDIASGETTVVFEGVMLNPSFLSGILSLSSMGDDLEGMFGDM